MTDRANKRFEITDRAPRRISVTELAQALGAQEVSGTRRGPLSPIGLIAQTEKAGQKVALSENPGPDLVYVLTEQVQSGSENGETFWILGAYRTEAAATAALDGARASHSSDHDARGCSIPEGEFWCPDCGHGFEVHQQTLEGR